MVLGTLLTPIASALDQGSAPERPPVAAAAYVRLLQNSILRY